MTIKKIHLFSIFSSTIMLMAFAAITQADGANINKIYHPYVNLLESEMEYRSVFYSDDQEGNSKQKHQIGLGKSLSDRWFSEIYIVAEKQENGSFNIDEYEMELKLQLTEQGEYNQDWGLLFELERNTNENFWEYSNSVIVLQQWGKWIGTVNGTISYEWGSGIKDEVELSASAQLKYKYKREMEPAIEFFFGEDTLASGLMLSGEQRLANNKKVLWQGGIIFGLNSATPDENLVFNLELEF